MRQEGDAQVHDRGRLFPVEGMDLPSVLVTVMPILRHLMLHFHCFRTMPVLG